MKGWKHVASGHGKCAVKELIKMGVVYAPVSTQTAELYVDSTLQMVVVVSQAAVFVLI